MPYLTPDEIPESATCRTLLIPSSSDWLAIVSGALTELTKSYNWQQQGSVTVDEAIAVMSAMIDEYYTGCTSCVLPMGQRPIRVSHTGHVEELIGDEWVEPEGDYAIPPITAREEGTEADQICLAAKNAVNVLEMLYEQVSEYFAAELSEAEAILAFVEFVGTTLGIAFAPITAAILIFALPIFAIFFAMMQYLTADLWDEDFSNNLICILTDCAENTAGVVTFDWDCFMEKLNAQVNNFLLSETQLRLNVQIGYLLSVIGGVDALNTAGATTEITNDDCSFCEPTFCIEIPYPEEGVTPATNTCAGGQGQWYYQVQIALNEVGSSSLYQIDHIEMDVVYTGSGIPAGNIYFSRGNVNCTFEEFYHVGESAPGTVLYELDPVDMYTQVNRIFFLASCSNNESNSMGATLQITRIRIEGHAITQLPDRILDFVGYYCD